MLFRCSTSTNANVANNFWHFLCFTWNGKDGQIVFYFGGFRQGDQILRDSLKTSVPADGYFKIGGAGSFIGTIGYLNVWSSNLQSSSITAMASGGMNVNGDLLSGR